MTEKIKIRRRSQSEWMLWFVAVFPFVGQFMMSELHIPSMVKYLVDAALFFLLLLNINIIKISVSNFLIFIWVFLFLLYAVLGYMFHFQSIVFCLWGVRNNFRFYLFFILCLMIFKRRDIHYFCNIFYCFFYLNVIVVSVQYWIMGFKQDYLGGMFGTEKGNNGWMNILLIIVMSKVVLDYLNKREKLTKCTFKIACSTYIAVLSEMKFYFVEMIVIVAIALVITNFSWRKFILIISVTGIILLGGNLLMFIYPEWNEFFSLNSFLTIGLDEKGYTGIGDLNRLSGVKTIATQYMDTVSHFLFGYGIGNCDYNASFSFLRTPFYETYGWLHYTWMSVTFIFFEMGAIGLFFFFGFFLVVLWNIRKQPFRTREMKEVGQWAQIVAILCLFIGIYNASLRTDAAYMIYLVLSFPFLKEKDGKYRRGGNQNEY